jgi:hypothetical protein
MMGLLGDQLIRDAPLWMRSRPSTFDIGISPAGHGESLGVWSLALADERQQRLSEASGIAGSFIPVVAPRNRRLFFVPW